MEEHEGNDGRKQGEEEEEDEEEDDIDDEPRHCLVCNVQFRGGTLEACGYPLQLGGGFPEPNEYGCTKVVCYRCI